MVYLSPHFRIPLLINLTIDQRQIGDPVIQAVRVIPVSYILFSSLTNIRYVIHLIISRSN